VKQKNISKLRGKNATVPEEQWDGVLQYLLRGISQHGDPTQMAVMEGIEAIARVDSNAMVIVIQKRIEGITVKHIGLHIM
jgi:hypothetical protein